MDNFKIDIAAEGDESLAKALSLAFAHNAPGGKATHYSAVKIGESTTFYARQPRAKEDANVLPREGGSDVPLCVHSSREVKEMERGHLTLMLLWTDSKDAIPLPFEMDLDETIEFVRGWLKKKGDAGPEPDHDGDNGKGWRVFTDEWGHVGECSYAICGIQATWAMYGK